MRRFTVEGRDVFIALATGIHKVFAVLFANLFDGFLKSNNVSALQPPLKQTFHLEKKLF